MNKFQPHINVDYPPNNKIIFEEWFTENYKGCNTDRELMPFFPTSYFVNNGYNENEQANREAQEYIDSLDANKKWFVLCQYDNGCIVDWKGKDVLEFNMSKQNGVMLPLLCQPHPYKFDTPKKYIASFVGSRTHPIRNELEKFKDKEEWYISFEPHSIEDYCRILHESWFSICPRGYGLNSFRISESLQYGSIPIYLSDEFIIPFNKDRYIEFLPGWWMFLSSHLVNNLPYEINRLRPEHIIQLQGAGKLAYEKYYSYEGCFNNIINYLEHEGKPKTTHNNGK